LGTFFSRAPHALFELRELKGCSRSLCDAPIGLGKMLGNLEVEQGRVLYFAGENYVDIQMRWIAMAQQMDFDVKTIPVHFRRGRFKLSKKWISSA
jgi:hypothetical protein